ncbi:PIN domain-containing protein [soil metagenome]|jgi:predicted nucleic acid-binding protein
MSANYFIDTNIFIYQLEALDGSKSVTADGLIRKGIETKDACISFQVVQECLNTALRKAEIPLSVDEMRTYIDNVLEPLFRVPASIPLYKRALGIQARYGYSFYDSLIVAAALDAGCERIYSEDMQSGQRIEGLKIENPFES